MCRVRCTCFVKIKKNNENKIKLIKKKQKKYLEIFNALYCMVIFF